MKNFLLFLMICVIQWSINAQDIPNITLETLDGHAISTTDVLKSDTIQILSFWATWCVPCINELDAISDVYSDWQDETNVELFAISTDDSRTQKRVKPLVNGKGWEYKILLDENQELKRALNIATLPHVIVVKNGKIIYRHSGYTPGAEDELFEIIQKHSK